MCNIFRVMLIYDCFEAKEPVFIRKKTPQKFSALSLEGNQLLDANHNHSVKCSGCKKTLTWSKPVLLDECNYLSYENGLPAQWRARDPDSCLRRHSWPPPSLGKHLEKTSGQLRVAVRCLGYKIQFVKKILFFSVKSLGVFLMSFHCWKACQGMFFPFISAF